MINSITPLPCYFIKWLFIITMITEDDNSLLFDWQQQHDNEPEHKSSYIKFKRSKSSSGIDNGKNKMTVLVS